MADRDEILVHPPNPRLERLARVVIRHRVLVLLLTLLATVGAGALARHKLRRDTSVEAFASEDSDTQRVLEIYRDEFGRDDVYALLIEGDVFSPEYVRRLDALHRELAGLQVDVKSLGERKSDRQAARTGIGPTAKPTPAPTDDFGFEETGDDGWGDEAGGSIVEEITPLINGGRTRATRAGLGLVVGAVW